MTPYELDTWIMKKLDEVDRLFIRHDEDRLSYRDEK
jgi:hypothetical protein